ncbi:MAG TPA: butyryl-CoA dehydrogenase [Clostridiales bacterium]|nr:butyryl-CoA dehydrogenase [Clostridiales bacterium]HCW52045.1 butyryl-CoA dehydrogenase [Clostridiales bacterium]
MDFALSEEHRMVQRIAREFAEKEVAPHIRENDEKGFFDRRLLDRMGELGLLGMCLPEKYGGGGLDYISLAVASEELERVDTSLRVVLSVHIGLCSLGILQWGTEDQRKRYLPDLAQGRRIGAFGLTEPNAGSDVAALEATAVRDGDEYVLNGEKTWISLADVADTFLVFAYTDKSKRHRGISAFIVERGFKGFSSSSIHGKLGVRAGNTGSLVLEDCRVPAANLLGEEGEGFKIAMSCLDNGRFTVAAGAVGLIQACIDASVKYANERRTFGVPLAEHQLVQRMIAHMVRDCEACRLLVYRAGWLKNRGERNTRETALAKWAATEASFRAASDAVQIHGAYGYCNEYPVERFLRNSKGAVIYEGSREILEIMVGQYALGLRRDKPIRRTLPGWPYEEEGGAGA